MKRIKVMSLLLVILLVFGTVIRMETSIQTDNGESLNDREPRINRVISNYAYDVTDIEDVVNEVDAIFVGRIKSIDGYFYENIKEMEKENHKKETIYDTYTNYSIYVEDVLKGELRKNEVHKVIKAGGVEKDGMTISLIDNDTLPKEGERYVFLAFKQNDGKLLLVGEKSNISLSKKGEIREAINDA